MEIVASYLNVSIVYMRKRERKEKLEHWDIECTCKGCSLEECELKENEELRTKILNLHEDIPKLILRGDVASALSAAKDKLVLMEKIKDELCSLDSERTWLGGCLGGERGEPFLESNFLVPYFKFFM